MPTFENYKATQLIRAIYLGDTGAGKTGSLCSLAAAGYNVRVLDLDKGVDIISGYVNSGLSIYNRAREGLWTDEQAKTIHKRLSYVTITEKITIKGGTPIPKGDAWQRISAQLDKWIDGELNLGNIGTWGEQDILVIDGLSRLAQAALNFQLALGGRLLSGPEQGDWYKAQGLTERLLQMLTSEEIKCHVIVCCHIAFIDNDMGLTKGYPQTIGKALSPKVGQSFNHALLAKSTGQGTLAKRVIVTNTAGMVELKNTSPLLVKAEYPLETGLAEYFKAVRGEAK